jgi:hypothetical protein
LDVNKAFDFIISEVGAKQYGRIATSAFRETTHSNRKILARNCFKHGPQVVRQLFDTFDIVAHLMAEPISPCLLHRQEPSQMLQVNPTCYKPARWLRAFFSLLLQQRDAATFAD